MKLSIISLYFGVIICHVFVSELAQSQPGPSIQGFDTSFASKDHKALLEWISRPKNLEFFISDPEHVIYLMENACEKFSTILPSILSYFSKICTNNNDLPENNSLWPLFRDAVLQYARIEDLKFIFADEQSKSLLETTHWLSLALTCSKRACFSTSDPEEQEKEARILVGSGIFDIEQVHVVGDLNILFWRSGPQRTVSEILLKVLFSENHISLDNPCLAAPLAHTFAWELVDEVVSNCDRTRITRKHWDKILIASAHVSWEKFEALYSVVPPGHCEKRWVFFESLVYPALEEFCDRLWKEDGVQDSVKTTDGYKLIFCFSSGNAKYLQLLLKDQNFLDFVKNEFDEILSLESLSTKAVDVLLASDIFKDLVRENELFDCAQHLSSEFSSGKCSPSSKLLLGCCSYKLSQETVTKFVKNGKLAVNDEHMHHFSETFWDDFDEHIKVDILKYFTARNLVKPLVQILGRADSGKFKLSDLADGIKLRDRRRTLETVSFFDSVEVDDLPGCPWFSIDKELTVIMKESRKDLRKFYQIIKGKDFNQYSYNWAAKYCVFHNDLGLMVQLGLHMLLSAKQEQAFACSAMAIQMASLVVYTGGSPFFLIKDATNIILQDLFSEAKELQTSLNDKVEPQTYF